MRAQTSELEREILGKIESEGPITFKDFMNLALYHPIFGYYNTARPKIGRDGDYHTSSSVHSIFGSVLATFFIQLWRDASCGGVSLDSLGRLTLVEIGAGDGRLAFDIITALRNEYPDAYDRLRYVIVETSPAFREAQIRTLESFGKLVSWDSLANLGPGAVSGIVFSNELIDAMPVHCIRMRGGNLQELYVASAGSSRFSSRSGVCEFGIPAGDTRFRLVWGQGSTARLGEYVGLMGADAGEGQVIEVNLAAIEWLASIAAIMRTGFLVTIDYGDLAEHLYGPDRREGTVRSFWKHRLAAPLSRVGEQDITASVNFTALIRYGRHFKLEPISFERQAAFLLRMGLLERLQREQAAKNSLPGLKDRLAIKNFFVPGGISDNFRVLVQRKCESGGH